MPVEQHDSDRAGGLMSADEFVARGMLIINEQRLVEAAIRERRRLKRARNTMDRALDLTVRRADR